MHKSTRTKKEPPSLPHGLPARNRIHNSPLSPPLYKPQGQTPRHKQKRLGKCVLTGKEKKIKKKKISTRNHSTRRVQDSPRSELARKETQETTQTDYAKERKVKPTAGERDIRSNNNTHTHKPKLRTGRSFPAFRVVNVTLGTAPSTGRTPSWRKTRERQNAVASLYTNRRIRARKTERVRKRTKKRRE